MLRAVRDQVVIDSWAKQVEKYRSSEKNTIKAFAFIFVALFSLVVYFYSFSLNNSIIVFLIVLACCVFRLDMISRKCKCPHCKKYPLRFERMDVAQVDFCRYCHYWLVDPIRR